MEYEVIATLGPGSSEPAIWQAMLGAGATAFRLNTSHLNLAQLHDWLERLRPFLSSRPAPVPLVLDLQGSKWRVGECPTVELREGQVVALVDPDFDGENPAQSDVLYLPVPHPDFFKAAGQSTSEIVLNDAKVRLAVERLEEKQVWARVTQAGPLSAHKGITFADSAFRAERLSEKDQAIIEQTAAIEQVRYAISYVKDAAEMERYRDLVGRRTARRPYLIAKLERGPAMSEAAQIARSAQEVWVCRGDLGAELGLRAMAEAVHQFTAELPGLPVPSIMAGQVLEHMTGHPTPTRSEVCYLYDCLRQGYHGFVLSDEAAVGRYPVESCRAAATWMERTLS